MSQSLQNIPRIRLLYGEQQDKSSPDGAQAFDREKEEERYRSDYTRSDTIGSLTISTRS